MPHAAEAPADEDQRLDALVAFLSRDNGPLWNYHLLDLLSVKPW